LMEQVNGPVLIEDSAVIFHALNGLPGPYMYVFPSCLPSAFNDFTSLIPR
jgi:inosine/xanthosine triphosphate pyrophosphatase family protein